MEAIKKTEVSKQGTTDNSVAQNSRSATISICDLISKINPKDANFLKYIPNQLLNNEQIEAKNKILEDGSFSSGSPMQRARENLTRYENGEITREEYLEENDRLWGEANEKHGIINQGENSQTPTPIAVPQAVADDKPTERFVRTILETGKLTSEMVENIEAQVLLGDFSYTAISDDSATQKAGTRLCIFFSIFTV